jgi:hypothetical protein
MERRTPHRFGRAALAVAAALFVLVTLGLMAGVGFAKDSSSSESYEYGGGEKVTICHHTGSTKNPTVTITVSKNAVPAHLKHGDTLGPCPDGS